jgi:hypothetical protein
VDITIQGLAKVASDHATTTTTQPKAGAVTLSAMNSLQQGSAQDKHADSLINTTKQTTTTSKVLANQQLVRPMPRT